MIKKFSFGFILFLFIANYGQVSTRSPYSYFGLGDSNQQITVSASGMGGINLGLNPESELNFVNPSLLSNIQFTVFDIGGKSQFLKLKDGSQEQQTAQSELSYIAFGFPITKKMGFMLGLQPNTNVGYKIYNETYDSEGNVNEIRYYNGNGGTNRFFVGTGYQILKELSLGVEGEVLFGQIKNEIINKNSESQLYTKYNKNTDANGLAIKIGLAYENKLNNTLNYKIESSIKLENSIRAVSSDYLYTFMYDTYGKIVPQDTLFKNVEIEGKIKRPLLFHSGFGLGKQNKWFAGLEYNYQKAWTFNSDLLENLKYKNTNYSSLKLGGLYLPKHNSIASYWNRVVYRVGARYEMSGFSLLTNESNSSYSELNDFGISFGLGLPIGNQLSKLNFSIEYGKRGDTTKGLIQENYFNLRFGINLSDKWFLKNKIY